MNGFFPFIYEKSKKKEWEPESLQIELIPPPPKKEQEKDEDSSPIIIIQL
jgi:hypothetical protein